MPIDKQKLEELNEVRHSKRMCHLHDSEQEVIQWAYVQLSHDGPIVKLSRDIFEYIVEKLEDKHGQYLSDFGENHPLTKEIEQVLEELDPLEDGESIHLKEVANG